MKLEVAPGVASLNHAWRLNSPEESVGPLKGLLRRIQPFANRVYQAPWDASAAAWAQTDTTKEGRRREG